MVDKTRVIVISETLLYVALVGEEVEPLGGDVPMICD